MLVSIIVPVYNVAEYLPMCLDSLLAQSHKELDIILIEDCSTDDSLRICREYSSRDNRITLFRLPKNSGVSAARNMGLDNANGEIITFCDPDDTVHENFISCFVTILKDPNIDIACCNYKITLDPNYIPNRDVDGTGRITSFLLPREAFCAVNGGILGSGCWNKAFRRTLIEENRIRFHPLHINEDLVFLVDCVRKCKGTRHIDYANYYYYKRPSGQMDAEVTERSMSIVEAYNLILEIAKDDFPSEIPLVMAGRAWSAASRLMRINKGNPNETEYRTIFRRLLWDSRSGLFEKRYSLKLRFVSAMMLLAPHLTAKLCSVRRSFRS